MTESLRVALADLNGRARGKRFPISDMTKIEKGAARMPLSVSNVDMFGCDIDGSPLVFETGDADGTLMPTDRGPVPMPWMPRPAVMVPVTMYQNDAPFVGDPRGALQTVLARFAEKKLHVVAATELEFTLVDGASEHPLPPMDPVTGLRLSTEDVNGLDALDAFSVFFDDLYDGADAMGISAQSALSESGIGQFEVNLAHGDALRAADDTWLFKQLVQGTARQHGFAASFLAKPYPDDAGNGLHTHMSVLDADGRNVFDDGTDLGTDLLRHGIGGCLEHMIASTLIFAPHGLSYDRFVDAAHAPTALAWGYDNRTVALRVPNSPPIARRIEHRVAGGDTNPYLLFAVILGAVLDGIEKRSDPGAPVVGNAYAADLAQIPTTWGAAIDAIETSPDIARILPQELIENFVRTKRQEMRKTADMSELDRRAFYLTRA